MIQSCQYYRAEEPLKRLVDWYSPVARWLPLPHYGGNFDDSTRAQIFHDDTPFGYARRIHIDASPSTRNSAAYPTAHSCSVRVCVGHTQRFLQACHRFHKPGTADFVTCPVRYRSPCSPGISTAMPGLVLVGTSDITEELVLSLCTQSCWRTKGGVMAVAQISPGRQNRERDCCM